MLRMLSSVLTNQQVPSAVLEELKDFTTNANSFFTLIRLPAATIAGSSLTATFIRFSSHQKVLGDDDDDDDDDGFRSSTMSSHHHIKQILIRCYPISMFLAFALAMTTVIISHSATVTILQQRERFDPNATSPYALLRREFDYEFCLCRWCYLMSILCFIMGITTRVILEFDLLNTTRTYYRRVVLCTMLSVVCNMMSYVNRTLYGWSNFLELSIHVIRLLIQKSINEYLPLQLISLVSAILAVCFAIHVIFFDERNPPCCQENQQQRRIVTTMSSNERLILGGNGQQNGHHKHE